MSLAETKGAALPFILSFVQACPPSACLAGTKPDVCLCLVQSRNSEFEGRTVEVVFTLCKIVTISNGAEHAPHRAGSSLVVVCSMCRCGPSTHAAHTCNSSPSRCVERSQPISCPPELRTRFATNTRALLDDNRSARIPGKTPRVAPAQMLNIPQLTFTMKPKK